MNAVPWRGESGAERREKNDQAFHFPRAAGSWLSKSLNHQFIMEELDAAWTRRESVGRGAGCQYH